MTIRYYLTTFEWKAAAWRDIRERLGLTMTDVYNETGIDPYYVENRGKTGWQDKVILATFYNNLLREEDADIRMSLTS